MNAEAWETATELTELPMKHSRLAIRKLIKLMARAYQTPHETKQLLVELDLPVYAFTVNNNAEQTWHRVLGQLRNRGKLVLTLRHVFKQKPWVKTEAIKFLGWRRLKPAAKGIEKPFRHLRHNYGLLPGVAAWVRDNVEDVRAYRDGDERDALAALASAIFLHEGTDVLRAAIHAVENEGASNEAE